MRHILPILLILFTATLSAQTAGQSSIPKKNSGNGSTLESFTIGNSQIIGRTAAGTLSGFTLGSGLTLTGSTLSISGGSSTLAGLSDVALTSISNNNLLRYNSTSGKWENVAGSTYAITADLGALATLNAVSTATITDGTIVNADIAADASIALSKLATDPLARANHTGTQAWSTLADTPTTLAGYGITDAYTASQISSYYATLNSPALTGVVTAGSRAFVTGTAYKIQLEANDPPFVKFFNLTSGGMGRIAAPTLGADDDWLWSLPPAGGTVALTSDITTALGGLGTFATKSGSDTIDMTGGALVWSTSALQIAETGITADGDIAAGAFLGDGAAITGLDAAHMTAGTLDIARIANGSVTNAKLANSSITINGSAVSLGGSTTISTGLTIGTTTITSGTTGRYLYNNGGVLGERTSAQVLSDIAAAGLASNSYNGAQTITLGTNSATPVTAQTLTNTTDATLGVQSASPATLWQGEGWRSGNSTNHTLAYRAYTLPVQGSSADPTAEWRLGLSVDGGAVVDKLKVGADKTTILSTDTTGQVLSLAGYYSTVNFVIGGSGDLHFNTIATFPSSIGTRFEEFGNPANYVGVAASASQQILNTSSGTLRLGLPAASPASMTITGAGARVGTDTNTSVTNAVNFAGPNGTGTGTGGKLDLGYIAPTTTGTAAGSFTSRIALMGGGEIIVSTKAAPSSASDTGTAGEVRIAGGYLYYCSATNTWLRAALTTW